MAETITAQRRILLQMVGKFPDVTRDKLLGLKGVTEADIAYLIAQDLIREQRTPGCYRVSHLGRMAIERGM